MHVIGYVTFWASHAARGGPAERISPWVHVHLLIWRRERATYTTRRETKRGTTISSFLSLLKRLYLLVSFAWKITNLLLVPNCPSHLCRGHHKRTLPGHRTRQASWCAPVTPATEGKELWDRAGVLVGLHTGNVMTKGCPQQRFSLALSLKTGERNADRGGRCAENPVLPVVGEHPGPVSVFVENAIHGDQVGAPCCVLPSFSCYDRSWVCLQKGQGLL